LKRSPIKKVGKNARSESKTLHDNTPYFTVRSGGYWLTWDKWPHSIECCCEICGAFVGDVMYHRAHIDERRSEADDNIWNIIVACAGCHNHDKYPDGGLKCGTEEAKRIVRERNETHGIGGK